MSYETWTFIAVLLFAFVHLLAPKALLLSRTHQGRFLSLGGGVAISYVFIDLIPKLGKSNELVQRALAGFFPYIERHVFVLALIGFLLFFTLERKHPVKKISRKFWLSITSYAIFNFLIGYSVVDKNNPEVQPLALFTIAMGLHYFTNDYALSDAYGDTYKRKGKWILITALFLGWIVGFITQLSKTSVALMGAFISGGVIMNVTRHELPSEKPNNVRSFLLSAITYTILLLALRSKA